MNILHCPTPFKDSERASFHRHSASVHAQKCWGCGVEVVVFYGKERAWWAAAKFIIEEEPW